MSLKFLHDLLLFSGGKTRLCVRIILRQAHAAVAAFDYSATFNRACRSLREDPDAAPANGCDVRKLPGNVTNVQGVMRNVF